MSFIDPKCIYLGREDGKYFAHMGNGAYFRIGLNNSLEDLIEFIETHDKDRLYLFCFSEFEDLKWRFTERKNMIQLLKELRDNGI